MNDSQNHDPNQQPPVQPQQNTAPPYSGYTTQPQQNTAPPYSGYTTQPQQQNPAPPYSGYTTQPQQQNPAPPYSGYTTQPQQQNPVGYEPPVQPQQNTTPPYSGYTTQPQQQNPVDYGQPAQYGQQPVSSPYPQAAYGGQVPIVPKKKNKFSAAIFFALITIVLLLFNIFTGSFTAIKAAETPTPETLDVNNMQAYVGQYVTLDVNYTEFEYAYSGSSEANFTSMESMVAQFDYANPENAFLFGVWNDYADYSAFYSWEESWFGAWKSIWNNEIGMEDSFFYDYSQWVDVWTSGYYKEWGKYASSLDKLPTYTITGYLMDMDPESAEFFDSTLTDFSIPLDLGKHFIIKQNYVTETENMEAYAARVKSEKTMATVKIIALGASAAITILLLILAVLKKDKPAPAMAAAYPGAPTYPDNQYGAPSDPYAPSGGQNAPMVPLPYQATPVAQAYTTPVAPTATADPFATAKPADTQNADDTSTPYPPSSPTV